MRLGYAVAPTYHSRYREPSVVDIRPRVIRGGVLRSDSVRRVLGCIREWRVLARLGLRCRMAGIVCRCRFRGHAGFPPSSG